MYSPGTGIVAEAAISCGSFSLERWYAVWSRPHEEAKAHLNLQAQGFESLFPTIRAAKGAWQPMFPRYLFVRFDIKTANWRSIYSTRGVKSLLTSAPEVPAPITDAAIERVLKVIEQFATPTEQVRIQRGDLVTIKTGRFQGRSGVCTWSSRRRVGLLMDLMGGKVEVTVSRKEVDL